MFHRRIAIAVLVLLAGWSAQQFAAPPAPYPTTATPQAVFAPAVPLIQPAPPPAAIYPPQSAIVPVPSQIPGSVFGPPLVQPLPAPAGVPVPQPIVTPGVATGPPNPISVPVVDEELAWDQIADVVSDYFKISREQRARRSGEVWTEGRIETAPQDGATWLEPHRADSVGTFNRWESTFQSIRRRATIRVIPDAAGYQVEVVVEKELEDLPRPEKATIGPATAHHDEHTLPSHRLERTSRVPSSKRWIQLGRDPPLEQRMLADIHARLTGATTRRSVFAP